MSQQQAAKRQMWQARLARAKAAYAPELSAMQLRDDYYNGSHKTFSPSGKQGKQGGNVRNIVYELIESQTDASIPAPKVTPVHPEDAALAKQIETMLANISRQGFRKINDLQERTVLVQGGDFWQLEWNPSGGYHCTMGEVVVSERHPRQVIPQEGVFELEQMEYIFLQLSQTPAAIQRRYGITLDDQTEQDGLVTQTIAYYKNSTGGIGRFSWVGDQTLEDLDDFQALQLRKCKRCGAVHGAEVCACGSRKHSLVPLHKQQIPLRVLQQRQDLFGDAYLALPVRNPDGTLQLDNQTGQPILQPTVCKKVMVDCYKPKGYPLILRRSLRKNDSFLGMSDVDVIADQQNAINKYGAKIEEKLLKGGSYVTLPQGVQIETTDRELKILRLKNPADKAMIDVLNIQPDTGRDQQMLEVNYAWAKSTLGITDAFQGKYDSSAVSGVAKQFSANQSAGRLQTKREMKNEAYAQLYKQIFQCMLAYCEQPYPTSRLLASGEREYGHFDRYAFLKKDDAGTLYWNDEFIFEVDSAASLTSNRETLWNMMDLKYQVGGFGPVQDLRSQHRLWTLLAAQSFPYADVVRDSLEQQLAEQKAATAEVPL